MTQRTFVFCDVCNPQGYRCPEQRRETHRGDRDGRRTSDSRSWFEGNFEAASENGWIKHETGIHACPDCAQHLHLLKNTYLQPEQQTERSFIFCDCCNPEGMRYIEYRRSGQRGDTRGRRKTDGRAWMIDNIELAALEGWKFTSDNHHYCPQCGERHPELITEVA